MEGSLIAPTLRGYRAAWLGPDLVAGLTLVAIAVPEQMATARLANMPPTTGLYAFVAGSVAFALIGRNRQLSVGADSTIAPILAIGVGALAAAGSSRYAPLISLLALMVGVLIVAVGLARLGWITELLSVPVITGILAGIAVEIFVHQLPALLGVAGGGTTTAGRLGNVIDQIGRANGWTVAIGLGVLGAIAVAERVDRRLPGALAGLVVSIVVVAALGLRSHGVAVLGSIHGGLPSFGLPSGSWADVRRLVVPAVTVAFVCIAQTAATVRASSAGAPAAGDFDRDLVGLGVGSVAAGISGSFAVDASPARSAVVQAAGGRSQLTSLVAAAVVVGVALPATGLLRDLPQATLGAILVFVATRLFRVGDLRAILRFDRVEFALAVVTLVAVAFIGIEQGVAIAIVISLADRTRRAVRPRDVVLGRVPGTDHWVPSDIGRSTEQMPGVVVYLLYAPLWYGNADYVRLRIRDLVDSATGPVHGLVIDANGVSDIDYTGARALLEMLTEMERRNVIVAVARASHLVHHDLKHSGLLQVIGDGQVFTSVEDAIDALVRSG